MADLSQERDALLAALAELSEEEQRRVALEAAGERARRARWSWDSKAGEAQTALAQAARDEPARAAYAFANGGDTLTISPVQEHQGALETANSEVRRYAQIEASIDTELSASAARIRRRQAAVHSALANVVVGSDALAHLLSELEAAWARVRGIRKAFGIIDAALHGYLPSSYQSAYLNVPTLDPQALRVATDEAPAELWAAALDKLLSDPDATLPEEV